MWRAGYRLLLWIAFPFVLARLWWRGRREPGYHLNVAERFGFYQGEFSVRPVIWIHAVSVGETRAAEPLVRALAARYPDSDLLLTHMTATGRDAARQLYADMGSVRLVWLPYDYPSAVRRFLRCFKPRLGVIMETEIWFNLVRECARHEVPLLLANARLSQHSARSYQMVEPLIREALSRISRIGAQTDEDASRLISLGTPANRIEVTGNIKFDVVIPAGATRLAKTWRQRYGNRKVLLAASLREGEEELLLDALRSMGGLAENALMVMVPRHPQRFDEVATILERRKIRFVRRSVDPVVPGDCAVVLGDSMGEMAVYYAACDCAFVGGSLLPYGGQNLVEACAAGVPVLIGPHTYNFAHAAKAAIAAGAAIRVSDAESLLKKVQQVFKDDELRARMGDAGLSFCRTHQGATSKTLAICEHLIGSSSSQ